MMALVDRALEINPSFARGWYISSMLRGWAGKHDVAIDHMNRSLRLTSRTRIGLTAYNVFGSAHLFSRRFEGLSDSSLALQEDPNYPTSYRFLAACCAHLGKLEEARRLLSELRQITDAVFRPRPMFRRLEDEELLRSGLRIEVK